MGVIIWWNNKEILDCANIIFSMLYSSITDILEKNNIKLNHDLRELIEDLERACYGWNLDIAKYIFSKEDCLFFIDLVENALEEFLSTNPRMSTYNHFYDNFLRELKIAYQDFKPNPLLPRSSNGTAYYPNAEEIRIILKFNKKYILACSKETYSMFYQFFIECSELQKSILNKNFDVFIQDIIHGKNGICLDFINYNFIETDLLIVINILCAAIDKIFETYELSDEDIIVFNNFYKELQSIKNDILLKE